MVISSRAAYLAFLGVVATERLYELVLSERNAKAALDRGGREVGQRHYRVMVVFHAAFLFSCAVEVITLERPFPPTLGWVALGVAVAAQLLRYWALTSLGSRWNTRIVYIPGVQPVTHGPYRFLRHPNYLAVMMEMVCIPLIHGAYLTAIVFSIGNALLLSVRIRAEEAALGDPYERAFARTPRFIPGGRGRG